MYSGLLPTPKETYNLNLIAVTLRIWSFRIPTSIFNTKELYNPGLLPSPRFNRQCVDFYKNPEPSQTYPANFKSFPKMRDKVVIFRVL